jgi:hypothetical protein
LRALRKRRGIGNEGRLGKLKRRRLAGRRRLGMQKNRRGLISVD